MILKTARRFKKPIVISLILIALTDWFYPTVAFALSSGPEQEEYISYESPGAPDFVNLLTGDFTYNLNLLDVPGPEGGFSVPLFYHAGIRPEQDASWVGLGWNINVGCIARSIVGTNDDAFDQGLTVYNSHPGSEKWVKDFVLYKRTWDSENGYGGAISLFDIAGMSWDDSDGAKTGTLLGTNFNKDHINSSFRDAALGLVSSAATIASFGTASSGIEVLKQAALQVGTQVAATAIVGSLTSYPAFSRYQNWNVLQSRSMFYNYQRIWLDDKRKERAFGTLYLGSTDHASISNPTLAAPDFNTVSGSKVSQYYPRIFKTPFIRKPSKGFAFWDYNTNETEVVTSDMFLNVRSGDNYADVVRPTHLSYDFYRVMTAGISGAISPYRLDVGTLAQPKRFNQSNVSLNLFPYVEEDDVENKVQFSYLGQFANKYQYHDEASFGVDHSVYTSTGDTYDDAGKKYLLYSVTSDRLMSNRAEVDPGRISNKKVVAGKNVEWFTRAQVASGEAQLQGFVPGYVPVESVPQDPNGPVQADPFPGKSIAGFMITSEDGLTYHYGLPVYKWNEADWLFDKNINAAYAYAFNSQFMATTWLLTAITGPDFVNRGDAAIGTEDWGYWVKFDYGKTSDFKYRIPYYGYEDDENNSQFSSGTREQVYLNSIQTRTHIGLFIKGKRTDGLSAYIKRQTPLAETDPRHFAESNTTTTPVQPLYLDEIVLMRNEDYNSLASSGFSKSQGSDLSIDKIWDISDVQSQHRTFIDEHALRRVKMVYETNEASKLCKKALNSFSNVSNAPVSDATDPYLNKQGKLTLKAIQFYGRNGIKAFPDYKFNYGFNPDYNKYKYDGWGYFNYSGSANKESHKVSADEQDGSAWSLSEVILPTGGRIQVAYERDTYSSVSGLPLYKEPVTYNPASYSFVYYNPSVLNELRVSSALVNNFAVNQQVRLKGSVEYTCSGSPLTHISNYSGTYTIRGVTSNSLLFDSNIMGITNCSEGSTITINASIGTAEIVETSKKGGGIRVSELQYVNEFGHVNKTKYTYVKSDNTTSSGVVSKEPELIKNSSNVDNYGLDHVFDYPSTGVMYSKVTVHGQYNRIYNDYSVKQVYEFITPSKDMVQESSVPSFDGSLGFSISNPVQLKKYAHDVKVKTASIGKINSIQLLDINNVVKESINFGYTQDFANQQGVYTAGAILAEVTGATTESTNPSIFKLMRTTKTYYPHVLTSITKAKDGFEATTVYKSWDFLTGIPTATETKSAGNFRTRTEIVPAYTASYVSGGSTVFPYSSMGLRGFNVNNKNMVGQVAGEYTYRLNDAGVAVALIGANVTTWKSNWTNYCTLNQSNGRYEDVSEGPAIWRQSGSYEWIGDYSRLRSDGLRTFGNSDKFDFSPGALNAGWKYLSSIERFDHYSMPLESTDLNNISSTTKLGYSDSYVIAKATNARYNEVAYSGAEDPLTNNYFGGEVYLGNGVTSSVKAHTGHKSLQLTTGVGFTYRSSGLSAGKAYKLSVWTDNVGGRLYYRINPDSGGPIVLSGAPTDTRKVGQWYKLDFEIPLQASTFSVEVGVTNSTGGTIHYDDFRFQPLNSSITGYVYSNETGALTYVLDNNNFFTQYEYNDRGEVVRTFVESFKYGVKKVSESSSDYRRFHIDQ